MNLESRLFKLERQNRVLRLLASGALVLAALPWALGSRAAVEESIRAKQFTLVDDDGVVLGTWSYDAEAKTTLLRVSSTIDGSAAIVLDSGPPRVVVDSRPVNEARHAQEPTGAVVLAASRADSALKMRDGRIHIERGGKTVFVAPPKMTVTPVTGG